MNSPPSADAWQAVGAIGTCAAVIVALTALVVQNVQRRKDQTARDAGQARLIVETSSGYVSSNIVKLEITNLSQAPAFNLRIESVHWIGLNARARWRLASTMAGISSELTVLAPGQTFETYVEFVDASNARVQLTQGGHWMRYSYLDASGLHWERSGREQPQRARE